MKKTFFMLLVSGLMLAACSNATPTPAAEVPIVVDNFAVSAEGRLVPANFVQLSFSAGGKVVEVLAAEGGAVAEGDVIARLGNSEALQAEAARTELEVLNARQALDDLKENAALVKAQLEAEAAQAREALDKAQRRLRNLSNPDIDFYQERVEDAQLALTQAQQESEITDIGAATAGLQAARDGLKLAEEYLGRVKSGNDGCGNCDPQSVEDAQDVYNDAAHAVRIAEIRLQQAQTANANAIEDAQKALEDSQQNLAAAQRSPDALKLAVAQAEASLAEARLTDVQRRLGKVQSGPDPDQLALAEARLATAQSALTAAKVALDNTELRAPFTGTVAKLGLKVGEQVAPGQAVVTLADFSSWRVETDNLTEIEVVKITEGQGADIVLDALPDVTLRGKVESIGTVFEEKRGDITYTVKVVLTEGNPLARWGLTAAVTFDK
ncbi:MAG: HlyD family efflux transporter periplasmic adaptor subunit [Chloroflexi bacterium]|nr:HlyD family efflux transporter periplasmic adaptor subunit [Chloroflexota bacterium]